MEVERQKMSGTTGKSRSQKRRGIATDNKTSPAEAAATASETEETDTERLRKAMNYQRQVLRSVPSGKKTTLG